MLCNKVIVNKALYDNSPTDDFDLVDVSMDKGCLVVTLAYGGGCGTVKAKLIDTGDVYTGDSNGVQSAPRNVTSQPAHRNVRVVFIDNDPCEMFITREDFYFDIEDLKVKNKDKVLLHFKRCSITNLYKY